jgi:hypothetical protein
MYWSSGLKARTSGKQNVQKKRQPSILPPPPVIGDLPKVARLYWELKDERVLSYFDIDAWSIVWRWKNLHPGTIPPQRTWHEEATETIFTSYLQRPSKDRLLDVLANSLPLGSIERRTGFYRGTGCEL